MGFRYSSAIVVRPTPSDGVPTGRFHTTVAASIAQTMEGANDATDLDSAGDHNRAGPYLQYVQRAVQAQFIGLVATIVPKRAETELLTLIGLLLFGSSLIVTPILVLADARYARSVEAGYQPGRLHWPILSLFVPFFGGYAYLWRRRRSMR